LVTAPEILFFWVARMIMAGYEYEGQKPFKDVYLTGIVRDKLGRKMSKSLGNSPDPLDMIARYGADAVRMGIMRAAPLGQDLLFDEQQVELGRNFCNKIWNACRFRQMQGGVVDAEITPELLTNDDIWMLSRLNLAIQELSKAFDEYNFAEAIQILYRFFWNEYCDWYVEAAKASLNSDNPKLKENTLAVIDFILSNTLRLFHPFLPFITEELWQGMGYSNDMTEDQGGKTIMNAPFPKPFDQDFLEFYNIKEEILTFVTAKYDLVVMGRNLRREGNVASNKKVRFVVKPLTQIDQHDLSVLKVLLHAEPLDVQPGYEPTKGTPSSRNSFAEIYLPMDELIDVEAERAKLVKLVEKYQTEIQRVEQRLNNPNFVEKAPPAVLEDNRKRLLEYQTMLSQTQNALNALDA
jgi:valyl-tRNA synthetase